MFKRWGSFTPYYDLTTLPYETPAPERNGVFGYAAGKLSETLGMPKEAYPDHWERIFAGRHPVTGEQIRNRHPRSTVAAYRFRIVVPPDTHDHLLELQARGLDDRGLRKNHEAAVTAAFDYLEDSVAAVLLRGSATHICGVEPREGVLFRIPQLLAIVQHVPPSGERGSWLTDLVIANYTFTEDGRCRALDGREFYYGARNAWKVYAEALGDGPRQPISAALAQQQVLA